MVTRLCACVSLLAVVAGNPIGLHAKPPVQSSRVTFNALTRVCGKYLKGDYIVVHDDREMAAGGPCTTFYRLRAGQAAEPVVSFHCIPSRRAAASRTTITTVPIAGVTNATQTVALIDYQIAADTDAHGVPR